MFERDTVEVELHGVRRGAMCERPAGHRQNVVLDCHLIDDPADSFREAKLEHRCRKMSCGGDETGTGSGSGVGSGGRYGREGSVPRNQRSIEGPYPTAMTRPGAPFGAGLSTA